MVDVGDEATSGPYNGGGHLWDGTTARRDCWDMGKALYHVLLILIKAPSNHPIPDSCGNPDPRWCPQSEVGLGTPLYNY